jgi:predicted nucleic acid-binding protein
VILVDTTPLVALCEPRDALHARALRDVDRVARWPLRVCASVLTEACFLLEDSVQRRRLARILADIPILPLTVEDEANVWTDAFRWLERYADHEPDWTDAYLAVASSHDRKAKVWTYDAEFRTTWRRLDGTRIPLAVRW